MEKPVIQVEAEIKARPSTVWKAMTRKNSAMFPGTEVLTTWAVGSSIVFRGEWKGKGFEDRGEIRSLTPEHQLEFTHWSPLSGTEDRPENYHLVRYDLAPKDDGTRVVLSQFNLGPNTNLSPDSKAEYEKNWRTMLKSLKSAAEEMTAD